MSQSVKGKENGGKILFLREEVDRDVILIHWMVAALFLKSKVSPKAGSDNVSMESVNVASGFFSLKDPIDYRPSSLTLVQVMMEFMKVRNMV